MLTDIMTDAKSNETPIRDMCFENESATWLDVSKTDFDLVRFVKCKFEACDFSKSNFYYAYFESCDFSNCKFNKSYWKSAEIVSCKGAGSDFSQSYFKEIRMEESAFNYANCVSTTWINCSIHGCSFKEAFMSEAKLTKIELAQVDFTHADFYKTPLKGVDLSDCAIDGIMVSDTYAEFRGARMNMFQAACIAQLLGIEIK
jgi:uncharacterized protein YjbI with pentapeptide repeats